MGLTPRPLFYAYPGRISNNPHESIEPRCVLPSMRTISAPADCTRPLLGSGRNRYVRILPSGTAERSLFRIVRQKLLYVTYPKLSGPFVEFHKAIFWVGGGMGSVLPPPVFRIVRRKLLYVVSAEGQRNAAPPYNPVRRSWQHVPGLLGCGFAAQNRKSRLSAAANKSCLKGRPFIIWSCRPAPYGNGQPVSAASTGRADSPACSGGGFRVEFFY